MNTLGGITRSNQTLRDLRSLTHDAPHYMMLAYDPDPKMLFTAASVDKDSDEITHHVRGYKTPHGAIRALAKKLREAKVVS